MTEADFAVMGGLIPFVPFKCLTGIRPVRAYQLKKDMSIKMFSLFYLPN
jgi:hypothetical protein